MSSCMWTSFHQFCVPEHHNLLQHMMNMYWFPTSNLVYCTNGMDRPQKNSYLVTFIPVQHWMNSWNCWDNVFSLRITKGKFVFSLLLNFPYKLKNWWEIIYEWIYLKVVGNTESLRRFSLWGTRKSYEVYVLYQHVCMHMCVHACLHVHMCFVGRVGCICVSVWKYWCKPSYFNLIPSCWKHEWSIHVCVCVCVREILWCLCVPH